MRSGLAGLLAVLLELAHQRLDRPIAATEVQNYYRSDARMGEVVQRLRRMDRAPQYHVYCRPHAYLLSPQIARWRWTTPRTSNSTATATATDRYGFRRRPDSSPWQSYPSLGSSISTLQPCIA